MVNVSMDLVIMKQFLFSRELEAVRLSFMQVGELDQGRITFIHIQILVVFGT